MSEQDVERVARAICGHMTGVPWGELPHTRQDAKARYRAGEISADTPYQDEIRDIARAAIDAMPGWRTDLENAPQGDECGEIDLWAYGTRHTDCTPDIEGGWVDDKGDWLSADSVTHWMLPEPPKE